MRTHQFLINIKNELEKVNIEQNLIKLPEVNLLNLEEHNPIVIDKLKEDNYEQEM